MKTAEGFKGLDDWQVVCRFLPEGWQAVALPFYDRLSKQLSILAAKGLS